MTPALDATYILPIRRTTPGDMSEMTRYLRGIAEQAELIVVDGSPKPIFDQHHARWGAFALHTPPSPERNCANGKVAGVLTGLDAARHERIVLADDDVRYEANELKRIVQLLDDAEVVRPQNYFEPLPWHALWDSGRSLLSRSVGGDWPGTFAVRRSALRSTGGYSGDVLFENLEMVRTIKAAGGHELVAADLFVRRVPPTAHHFVSQRVRQAYDEFARPVRMAWQLALLPMLVLTAVKRPRLLPALWLGTVAAAEVGRRRAGAQRVFPFAASLVAPLWLLERAVCSCLAVHLRLTKGGVAYSGYVLRKAATPERELRRRWMANGPQLTELRAKDGQEQTAR